MNIAIIFILGFFLGVAVVYFVMRHRKVSGIASHVKNQQSEKKERKEEILEIMRERVSVSNNDIERALNVSDTTATNYLQELERDGRIEQIGERGRFVSYRLKIM